MKKSKKGKWRVNMKILMVVVIVVWMMTSIAVAENENTVHITYKTEVDQDYGFYRIVDMTAHKSAPYKNNTLTVNIGDTVIWENDATPDEPLTIISKDNLWSNNVSYLRWNYQKFSYTFNQSGAYEVYIKEYPREQHQIILVKDVEIPVITVTPISTVTSTVTVGDTETPIETVSPISTETTSPKNTQNMYIVWLLIIIIGVAIFIIYRNRQK